MTKELNIESVDKVWYVTGSSKGIGLAIVKKLLEYRFKVVGTSRDKQQLIDVVGPLAKSDNFLAVQVDLTSEDSIKASLNETLSKFGRIDILVNNAGYCLSGALEESTDDDVFKNFEVNVFSIFKVLRSVAPILRSQKSGHVFNISSVAALNGRPGHSAYSASKFAVDGLTESFSKEVKEFGIKVTSVNLGAFRSNLLNTESYKQSRKIDAYQRLHNGYEYAVNKLNGKQRGDPSKIVDIFIRVYQASEVDTDHLFVGPDANNEVLAKIKDFMKDQKRWEEYTTKTDYDEFVDSSLKPIF